MYQKKIQERLDRLITNISKDFEVSKLAKSSARFNPDKLDWFNKEYIKKLSLSEFVFRSQKLIFDKKILDKKLRVVDYVYFVDFETSEIYLWDNPIMRDLLGEMYYHAPGGGRKLGETDIECVVREMSEELPDFEFNPDNLMPLGKYQRNSVVKFGNNFEGWDMTFFVYSVTNRENLPDKKYQPIKFGEPFGWYPLSEFITLNFYPRYELWREFCTANNLQILAPTETIIQQYLAYNLDKNRVTVLSEFGSDSDMVLKYVPSTQDILKFPKATVLESHNNLAKVSQFILDNWVDQADLLKTCKEDIENYANNTQAKFEEQITLWQDKLKAWIKTENLNMGSTLHPLRVALSGQKQSPSPFEMLSILSKQQVRERIELSLYILGQVENETN